MIDIVASKVRSQMMSNIKSKHSKPELCIRRLLFAAGFRYRLHQSHLPGNPDIIISGQKIAIFVHGCFWHAHRDCKYAKLPTTRPEFWRTKLQANTERDNQAANKLIDSGWRVLYVWECATRTKKNFDSVRDQLVNWINKGGVFGEVRGPNLK